MTTETQTPVSPPILHSLVRQWANKHLVCTDPDIEVWEQRFHDQEHSLVTMLRICGHDNGGWIVIGSCCSSVSEDESYWRFVNIGNVRSIGQLGSLLLAMAP